MAMAIRPCSKQSPALPNISIPSYSTKSYLKVSTHDINPPPYTQSSLNHTCSYTVQEDAFIVPSACTQQIAGAATVPVPVPACEREKFLDVKGSENDVKREHFWCSEVAVGRKRRRKRRSTSERVKKDEDERLAFVDKKGGKSRFMTPKEEASFSWYLKVYILYVTENCPKMRKKSLKYWFLS